MGGAAIVPRMAHVRNCEISDCQATQGGALMLLKGSIVSGSVIVRNKAQKGGAIYALRFLLYEVAHCFYFSLGGKDLAVFNDPLL